MGKNISFTPTLAPAGKGSQSVLRKPTVKSLSKHICAMTTDLRTYTIAKTTSLIGSKYSLVNLSQRSNPPIFSV